MGSDPSISVETLRHSVLFAALLPTFEVRYMRMCDERRGARVGLTDDLSTRYVSRVISKAQRSGYKVMRMHMLRGHEMSGMR